MRRFAGGTVRLILDGTQVNGRAFILFVAAAYRGRALPVAWRMIEKASVSSTPAEQEALLDAVADCLPADAEVVLLGDREYGTVPLVRYCQWRGWGFCLRAKTDRTDRVVLLPDGDGGGRTRLGTLLKGLGLAPRERRYYTGVTLPGAARRGGAPLAPVNLVCCGPAEAGGDPCLLLTDGPADAAVPRLYAGRMAVEEMFRDFKEQGFRLEQSRVTDPERMSRLLLGLCLAYVWLLLAGTAVTKRGWRRQVDRRAKRQLSYFQIGWRFLTSALMRDNGSGKPLPCWLTPYP